MKNEGLNSKQEKIVTIAAFTANGDLQKLKTALNEGLDAGLTVNEIKEILIQMYAYAGFPRSLNGINTFMGVLEEREQKGIKDELGREPSSLPANKTSIELGTEIQTSLIGAPATGKYITFAPAIDRFLKAHLFGDIFGRNILDFQGREIATIAALANIEGVNPQLQAHFNIGFNTGMTEMQMKSLISVLESNVGKKQADNAYEMLSNILSYKQAASVNASPITSAESSQKIRISQSGSLSSSKGSAEYFTGSVNINMLFKANDPLRASGGRVTFEPGARTAWHNHPFGQILIVTDGVGWVQQWGGLRDEMRQGDVVLIPPGVKHWHGATSTTGMTHIALQEQLDDKAAQWLEKVSDEQYQAKARATNMKQTAN